MSADEEHAELVRSLLVERYARNDWWTRKPSRETPTDDDLTCRRRLREALADVDAHGLEETA